MILCKDASLLIGECYNAFGGLQTELDEIKLVFPLNSFHWALILKKKGFCYHIPMQNLSFVTFVC